MLKFVCVCLFAAVNTMFQLIQLEPNIYCQEGGLAM